MPGPLPNPAARRRNAGSAFTELPASGRPGLAPPYPVPMAGEPDAARRATLWAQLWATPMAVLWERHGWTMPVARYVEALLAWEDSPRETSVAMMAELRQMEATLAMTPAALLRARASIPAREPGQVAPSVGEAAASGMATVVDLSTWGA